MIFLECGILEGNRRSEEEEECWRSWIPAVKDPEGGRIGVGLLFDHFLIFFPENLLS